MAHKPIKKAVFPVAGLGTRFLPATKAIPKEMLAIVDRPLIQYAVDEAREAGIEQMIFVTGRGKTAIVEHFDIAFELEQTMEERGKDLAILDSTRCHTGRHDTVHFADRSSTAMCCGAFGANRLVRMQPQNARINCCLVQ